MIRPKQAQSTKAVAAHYDELDAFYRDIWGEHVHHGYWETGGEKPDQAVVALIDLVAERLDLTKGQRVCDIGCGYGATARYLARRYQVDVTGVTVSAVQAEHPSSASIVHQDWLNNSFADNHFDRAYAMESSEHMTDKTVSSPRRFGR